MRRITGAALAILAAILFAVAQPAAAQDADGMAKAMQPLVDQARKDGMTVVVISPTAGEPAKAAPSMSMTEQGLMIRAKLRTIIRNVPDIPGQIVAVLRQASPDGTWFWLWRAVAVAVGGLVAGSLVSRLFRRFGQRSMAAFFNPEPQNRTEKIGYLLIRATLVSINCMLIFGVAVAVGLAFDNSHSAGRNTILAIVSAYVAYWVFRAVIFFNIIAPDLPGHRMINLDDSSAQAMQRDWRNAMIVVIFLFAFSRWLETLGLNEDALDFLLTVGMALSAALLIALIVRYRRAITGAVLGAGDPYGKSALRRILAASWPALAITYIVAAWAVSAYRLILELPSATWLIAAPAIALVAALPAYGIFLILIDRLYAQRRLRFDAKVRAAQEAAAEEASREAQFREETLSREPEAEAEQTEHFATDAPDGNDQYPVFRPLFKPLLEQAAGIALCLLGIGFILQRWGVSVGSRNPVTDSMDTVVIVFLAWFLYRAVILFIDDRLEAEGVGVSPHTNPADIGDEPSGQGVSRIATLLPIIRVVAVSAIVAISGMIVLSNFGVDVGPLFAGAGVVGLAIGFGAQTLIRDIFSGGFFLFDDAFRKGEYVEIGGTTGTVEKISLRSFQLRHHNGPLHTIPYGEISQVTNYSRDWVIMKLPLRLTYDTDVEKVRKLVKKLGQRLLEHPQVGGNFLQPLKSQGVVQMEDSAMIVRVKFMTKPGDQWVTRKVVYAEIRELFAREGIRFANREVTVRIADEHHLLDEQQKAEVAAGAARRVLDDEAEGKNVPATADSR